MKRHMCNLCEYNSAIGCIKNDECEYGNSYIDEDRLDYDPLEEEFEYDI